MPIEDFDWDTQCKTPVQDFPMYSERLKPIDWEAAVADGRDWKDPNFNTDNNSLLDKFCDSSDPKERERHERWKNYTWKRPEQIYGDGNFVLWDTIGPNDITQGACGDCYYLSSLAALAEFPDRIKRIFITKEVNSAGCYAVQMYINGEKRTVVVDDYFPYNEEA